jgi:hypothetical protein
MAEDFVVTSVATDEVETLPTNDLIAPTLGDDHVVATGPHDPFAERRAHDRGRRPHARRAARRSGGADGPRGDDQTDHGEYSTESHVL